MNEFTKPQLDVIDKLAGYYFDNVIGSVDPDAKEFWKKQYVDAITAGLTDPSYWGE